MAKAVLKFRCYRCDKLLGISPAQAGKTTTCPKCQADLVVPETDLPPDEDIRAAARALVPNLDESVTINEPKPGPKPQHEPGFSWEDLDATIFETAAEVDAVNLGIATALAPAPPEPPKAAPEPEPVPEPAPVPVAPIVPIVETSAPIVVPEIKVEAPVVRTERTSRTRPGDVVLTQGVIASWSVFMLLALAISFVAGVFVGHFLWKGP
jgi:phage FluMu protein Com